MKYRMRRELVFTFVVGACCLLAGILISNYIRGGTAECPPGLTPGGLDVAALTSSSSLSSSSSSVSSSSSASASASFSLSSPLASQSTLSEPALSSSSIMADQTSRKTSATSSSSASDSASLLLAPVERSYEYTYRSCLGVDCFADPVTISPGTSVSRVGLLSVPGSGAKSIMTLLSQVTTLIGPKVHFLEDSHVPPYGYGKNHGWSAIVRLARRVVPHTYSLLHARNWNSSTFSSSSPASATGTGSAVDELVVAAQMKQIVRWHCRLSHVAAHTRMLTVFLDDILARPVVEIEKIITFSGLKLDRPLIVDNTPTFLAALRAELYPERDRDGALQHWSDPETWLIQERISRAEINAGIDALRFEMKTSKKLTKWPCFSFRDVESVLTRQGGAVSALPLRSSDLAANCSAAYVKCSVQYDLVGG